MSLWHDLIRKYAAHSIEAPDLKIVTLAQWALESGFGTSTLSKDHKNFGGLKFRARINQDRPLATPVDYMAHDGLDTYCAFESFEDFFDGYWAFIDNGHFYDGWRAFSEDPSGYIGHLKEGGYAGDPDYVAKVLDLVPRIRREVNDLGLSEIFASELLSEPQKKRVAVLIGHNSQSKGTFSDYMQVSEWGYNKRVYDKMAALQGEYGIELKQFFRNKSSSYSKEIGANTNASRRVSILCGSDSDILKQPN